MLVKLKVHAPLKALAASPTSFSTPAVILL
jgi:hypothetical protein